MPKRMHMVVENLPDRRFIEAIFAPEIKQGSIVLHEGMTASGAISIAELYLLQNPEVPVALVLTTRTTDLQKITETRASAERILGRASPTNWHVSLAIPRLDAWAMLDPAVKNQFEAEPATTKDYPSQYVDRAVRVAQLAKSKPLDRKALSTCPEFRELYEFVKQHTAAQEVAAGR